MAVPAQSRAMQAEHALLLAAASVGPSVRDAADTALRSGVDWTLVVELALYHRMVPAMLKALDAADPSLSPSELRTALRSHCETLRAQSQVLIAELFELLDLLEMRGVAVIPFKGPLLGQMLFGDFGQRSPGDIDILVRREDIRTVCATLEARGYEDAGRGPRARPLTPGQQELYERFQCEYQYAREADDIVVEPHWGLSQRTLAIDLDYSGMLARARPTLLDGRQVLALTPEDLLVALCVHGAKHQWLRLAWVRDVAAVLAVFPRIDLDRVLSEARTRGYARIFLLSLAIAKDCGNAQLPDEMIRRISSDGTIVSLLDEIRSGLFDPDSEEPRNDRVDAFRWRMRERWSDRLHYVAATTFIPRRPHLEIVALPRPLDWGYYLVKLGVDFAISPLWNALKAVGAARVRSRWR